MNSPLFLPPRKSFMRIGEIYFWTATIHNWQKIMLTDDFKEVVIQSLHYLSEAKKIDVFAFVIMPNHVHFIWRLNEMNGKEPPHSSFLKHTAHTFNKLLKANTKLLSPYKVDLINKNYEFWQRDSLAIPLFNREVIKQKLDYIHLNPLKEHWALAQDPSEYRYSSARFYEQGEKLFGFLKDIRDEW